MGDALQSLRRLAKRFNIRDRRDGEEWPTAHRTMFQSIKSVAQYRFDTYIPGVSVYSEDKPWKQQTKAHAQWLVNRAECLFGQERNEAGWRFGLENDVLRRFTVEVAWWVERLQFTLRGHIIEACVPAFYGNPSTYL